MWRMGLDWVDLFFSHQKSTNIMCYLEFRIFGVDLVE